MSDETHPLQTMRGPLPGYHDFPGSLRAALVEYDGIRGTCSEYEYAETIARAKGSDDLKRLLLGLRILSFRSVCHVVTRRSHVDASYVRGKMGTLNTLIGLFWWNDGAGKCRQKLLELAWQKGRPQRQPRARLGAVAKPSSAERVANSSSLESRSQE